MVNPLTGRLIAQGVPAKDVAARAGRVRGRSSSTGVATLDTVIPVDVPPPTSREVLAVVEPLQ